jgi:hypothetical protein
MTCCPNGALEESIPFLIGSLVLKQLAKEQLADKACILTAGHCASHGASSGARSGQINVSIKACNLTNDENLKPGKFVNPDAFQL